MPYKPPRAKCVHCHAWLCEYDPATMTPGRTRPGVKLNPQHRTDRTVDTFPASALFVDPSPLTSRSDPATAWPATEAPATNERPPANFWVARCTVCKEKTSWHAPPAPGEAL